MPARIRKLIGILILLPYLVAYFLAAAVIADSVPDHWLAKLAYFILAGVIWIFPLKYLMRWMAANPDAPAIK